MRKKSMLILIVMLAIGFASVSATLIINGVAGIGVNTNNFVDGVVFDEESLSSSEGTTAEISESGRTITFTTQEMKSVDETATVNFKIKNYSQYNATLGTPAISCYFVDNHAVDTKAEVKSTTHEYMELIPGTNLDGKTINAGGSLSDESSVTVKQIKSYTGDTQTIKFQCEINASASDSETSGIDKPGKPTPAYELTNDANNNGIADIGEEIQVGTESFYVISHTDTEINALAKYNLNVGSEKNPDVTEGIQHETIKGYVSKGTAYGTVAFSNNNEWLEDNVGIKQYVGPTKDALYGENGYEKYIQNIIPNSSVRLLTYDEAKALKKSGYSWLYSTSYWIPYAESDDGYVLGIEAGSDSLSYSHFAIDFCYGVRPVITISETSSNEKPESSLEKYDLKVDENDNGIVDIGDEIQVGTESFYVISNTDTELNALAKYNLNVGKNKYSKAAEGIQFRRIRGWVESDPTYGTVAFSNNNGWTDENNSPINIKEYEGSVKDVLYGENGYEKYLQETIPDSSVRLITKEEIEELINDGNSLSDGSIKDKADAKGYSWLYSTTYWTKSAVSLNPHLVWSMHSYGNFSDYVFNYDDYCGIRPVITIPK